MPNILGVSGEIDVTTYWVNYALIEPQPVAPQTSHYVEAGKAEDFSAKGYWNGPNGTSEDGGGDDVEITVATFNWTTRNFC